MKKESLFGLMAQEHGLCRASFSLLMQLPELQIEKGAYLIHRFTRPGGLYFIAGGQARSYRHGEAMTRGIYLPGDIVAGPGQAFASGGADFLYVQAMPSVSCLYLSQAVLGRSMLALPDLGRLVAAAAEQERERLALREAIWALATARERYAYMMAVQPELRYVLDLARLAVYLGVSGVWLGKALKDRRVGVGMG